MLILKKPAKSERTTLPELRERSILVRQVIFDDFGVAEAETI